MAAVKKLHHEFVELKGISGLRFYWGSDVAAVQGQALQHVAGVEIWIGNVVNDKSLLNVVKKTESNKFRAEPTEFESTILQI